MALTQIKRDPYARASLTREYVRLDRHDHYACPWCGQGLKAGYRYAWVGDAQNVFSLLGPVYCGVSCYRAYSNDDR